MSLESLKHQPEAPRPVKIPSQAGKCATLAAHSREPAESWCRTFGLPGRRSGRELVGVKQRESKCLRGWRVRRRQCNNLYRLVSFRRAANTGVWKIILGPLTKLPKIQGFRLLVQRLADFKINRKVDGFFFFLTQTRVGLHNKINYGLSNCCYCCKTVWF